MDFGVILMNKTKGAIFDAAIKVFSGSGYDAATMDDIAVTAGVAKGTLYYHFKSKEEIFKFIIFEGTSMIREELKNAFNEETNSILRLKRACKVQLELVSTYRDFFKVAMSQLWGQEDRQKELRETLHSYIEYIEDLLKAAMSDGLIKKGETTFMAYTFIGSLFATAVYELLNKEKANSEEVIDNLVQYILNGVGCTA